MKTWVSRQHIRIRAPYKLSFVLLFLFVVLALRPGRAQTGPTVTGFKVNGVPSSTGPVGATLDILGSGFGSTEGFSTATLNGIAVAGNGVKPNSWTSTDIQVVIPKTASSGPVVVTLPGKKSNGVNFTIGAVVTGVTPASAPAGNSVTILGQGFGTSVGTVTFNGITTTTSGWTDASIVAQVPTGATTGNVLVSVNGFPSTGQLFTYTPQITGLSPNPALADTTVNIQGNNFNNQQNGSTVTFNGVAAAVTNWTNSTISATVPGNISAGPVVVTVNGVASNGFTFTLPGLYSFSLGYAPNGDVLTANDSVNGNWTYVYDDFNRLSTSSNTSPQQGFSYTYDQYGNRWRQDLTAGSGSSEDLTFTVTTQSSNGNCYHAAGLNNQPDGFCFDAAGNLLNDGAHSYTYDAENRIISVDGGNTAAYIYDAGGQRVQKVSAAGTAQYLYDLGDHVITEVSGTGVWTRGEVFAGGKHLATYGNGGSGTTYLVQADLLGTERTRVLPSGDLYETCINLPFGDGQSCTGATDPSPDHFTGKQRDTETSLDYFNARFYSSALGRFVTPDWDAKPTAVPYADFGDPQSLNLYGYVKNNPTTVDDPDGHQDDIDILDALKGAGKELVREAVDVLKLGNSSRMRIHTDPGFMAPMNQSEGYGAGLVFIGGFFVPGGGEQKAVAATRSVWDLGWGLRGELIETALGKNLSKSFPVIDKFLGGVATSIKSIDLTSKTYQNMDRLAAKISGYVDKVAAFRGARLGKDVVKASAIKARELELAIPAGSMSAAQQKVFGAAAASAEKQGVKLTVTEIK